MAQEQRFGRIFGRTVGNIGRDVVRDLINRGIDALSPEEKAQEQRFGSILRGIGRTVGREVVNVGRDAARDLGNRLIDRGADALRDLLPRAQLQQISDEELRNLAELCCMMAMAG